MPLSNTRIIVRIGLVVGTVFLLMLLLMLVELKALSNFRHHLDGIVLKSTEKLVLAQASLRFLARNSAVVVRNVLLTKDTGTIRSELDRLASDERKYQECLDSWRRWKRRREERNCWLRSRPAEQRPVISGARSLTLVMPMNRERRWPCCWNRFGASSAGGLTTWR